MNFETRKLNTSDYTVFSDIREQAEKFGSKKIGIVAVIRKPDTVDYIFVHTLMDHSLIRSNAKENGWEISYYAVMHNEFKSFKDMMIGPVDRD